MTAATPDTRTRIKAAAAALFRRDGYAATGLKRIATESAAPFGSIYHFFPGGKEQLAEDVILTSGAEYQRMVRALLDSVPDPLESLENAFAQAAAGLMATGYADACPIATIALEVASSNEKLRVATERVFDAWVAEGASWFGQWITDPEVARELATSMTMLLEGAFLLSRTRQSPEPLHMAGRSIVELTRRALEAQRAGGSFSG